MVTVRSEAEAGAAQLAVPAPRELVCGDCGYGVVVTAPPERCPMCQGNEWRPAAAGRRRAEPNPAEPR